MSIDPNNWADLLEQARWDIRAVYLIAWMAHLLPDAPFPFAEMTGSASYFGLSVIFFKPDPSTWATKISWG